MDTIYPCGYKMTEAQWSQLSAFTFKSILVLKGNRSLDFPLGDQPLPPLQEGAPLLPSFWKSSTHRTLYINNRFGRYLEMWPGRQIRGTPGRSPFCILVVLSHLSHVVMKGFISDQYLCMHPSTFRLYTRSRVHSHCYIQEAVRSGNIVYTFTRCRTPQNEACHLGMYLNGTMRPATDVRLSQTTAQWLAVDVSAEDVNHAVYVKEHLKRHGGWMTPTSAGRSSPVAAHATAVHVLQHTSSQAFHPPTPKSTSPTTRHFVTTTPSQSTYPTPPHSVDSKRVRPTAQPSVHPTTSRSVSSSHVDTTRQMPSQTVDPKEYLNSRQIGQRKELQNSPHTVFPKEHQISPLSLHPKEHQSLSQNLNPKENQTPPQSLHPKEHQIPSQTLLHPKEHQIPPQIVQPKEQQTSPQTLYPKEHPTSPQILHPKEQRRKRVRRWCRNLDVMVRRPDKFLRRCKHDCDVLRRMIRQPRRYQRRCLTALVRRHVRNKARDVDDSSALQQQQQNSVFNVTRIRAKTRRLWPERKTIFQRLRQLKRCSKKKRGKKNKRQKGKSRSCSVKNVRRQLKKRAKRRRQKTSGHEAEDSVSFPSLLDSASSSVVTPEHKIRHRHRSRGGHRHRARDTERQRKRDRGHQTQIARDTDHVTETQHLTEKT